MKAGQSSTIQLFWLSETFLDMTSNLSHARPSFRHPGDNAVQLVCRRGEFTGCRTYDDLTKNIWCDCFHYDVNNYFSSIGEK